MSESTLAIAAALAILTGLIYAYVGFRVGSRHVTGPARTAQGLFVLWWYALGASTIVGGIQIVAFSSGDLTLTAYKIIQQINLFAVVAALLGLLYYLVFLYTGSSRSLIPLSVGYFAFWGYLAYITAANPATSIVDDGWGISSEPTAFTGATLIVVLLGLVGPQIGASIALFRLFFKVEGATQKYRIALVSWAILVWFGVAVIASLTGLSDVSWWGLASRLIGLGAAVTILVAYVPPAFIQRKYGIESIAVKKRAG